MEEKPELDEGPFMKEEGNLIEEITRKLGEFVERQEAEKEKNRLEEQYHQAQKMESVGRLAGGVAHDLNNLLIPILGYGEMLRNDIGSDGAGLKFVDGIMEAGTRARDLVHRLLTFGRKQPLEYTVFDLNKAIGDFEDLLRRTVRENIEIKLILSADVQSIMADIGQIEQVIMNLTVNAADAMPDGGTLTIETAFSDLDDKYAATHLNVDLGRYVMLAISDTGCGMDEETKEHIFEPFFTTKGEGGTGLGLATVYSIVKQHNGSIWLYSEPGLGTTFKIYLPIPKEAGAEEKIVSSKPDTNLYGSETVLLVEDNEQVRDVSYSILVQYGYSVLVAENGNEALEVLENYKDQVHLLLTDVIMPGMDGTEVFAKVSSLYPDILVIYMSGYTNEVITHHGLSAKSVQFIQKPFTLKALAGKVREVLDG